ncbi:MAG: hypothetical protein WC471_03350 [Candidatus Woesearchaeota archaeon]
MVERSVYDSYQEPCHQGDFVDDSHGRIPQRRYQSSAGGRHLRPLRAHLLVWHSRHVPQQAPQEEVLMNLGQFILK